MSQAIRDLVDTASAGRPVYISSVRERFDALPPAEVRPELVPNGTGLQRAVRAHDGDAWSVSGATDVLWQHNERAG